jgi:predicted kinase
MAFKKVTIKFTRGLQGSGKSFWAKEFVKKNQDYKRVCRDDIRHMLSSYTFDNKNESLVTKIEESLIIDIINNGYNVIIDSMNLNKQKLNDRIDKYKAFWIAREIELYIEIKSFPIELQEAITRDKLRDFVIGEKVIKQTWKRYENELIEMLEESKKPKIVYDFKLPDCIVSDVDGTLAIKGKRSPYDFSKIHEDKISEPIRHLIISLQNSKITPVTLFIVSGRDDSCYDETSTWLTANKIDFSDLYMRKTGDRRKDSIVKRELYETHILGRYNCLYWVDDRKQVIDMVRNELGLTVLDIAGNIF